MSRTSSHALVAILTVCAICCTRWGPPLSPGRLRAERRATRVRVTLTDHRRFEVRHAGVRGDTLLGDTLGPANAARDSVVSVAIPFASIDSVSVGRSDWAGPAFGIAAVGMVVVVAVLGHELDKVSEAKESCHLGRID